MGSLCDMGSVGMTDHRGLLMEEALFTLGVLSNRTPLSPYTPKESIKRTPRQGMLICFFPYVVVWEKYTQTAHRQGLRVFQGVSLSLMGVNSK